MPESQDPFPFDEDDGQAVDPVERSTSAEPGARGEAGPPSGIMRSSDSPGRDPERPKKPWFDTYTAMLGFALLATIVACVLLALHLRRYNWELEPPTAMPPAVSLLDS